MLINHWLNLTSSKSPPVITAICIASVLVLTACSSSSPNSANTNPSADPAVTDPIVADPTVTDPVVEVDPIQPAEFPPTNAPSDCLFSTDNTGRVFCFSAETRTLRAWAQDGTDWWSFMLPGENERNSIRSLTVVGDQLVITARLNPTATERAFELSSFTLGGEFQVSLPILEAIRDNDSHAYDIDKVIVSNDSLLVAGTYGSYSSSPSWPTTPGTYLVRVDPASGDSLVTKRYPGLRFDDELHHTQGGIFITLSDINWQLNEATFDLANAIDPNANKLITIDNYSEQRTRFLEQLSNPPIDSLASTASNWYFQELERISNEQDTCPGGGTVSHSFGSTGFGDEWRNLSFNNCVSARFTLNGNLNTSNGNFCGRDCSGPRSTTTFDNFSASFTNGDRWLVDVEISTQTNRINFVREGELPPASFKDATTITQFERHDARGSLIIGPGLYEYSARGDDYQFQWSGSSNMTYNTGLTENIQVALSIENNSDGFLASGSFNASRSDGTSLTITPAADGMLLHEISNAQGVVQVISDW